MFVGGKTRIETKIMFPNNPNQRKSVHLFGAVRLNQTPWKFGGFGGEEIIVLNATASEIGSLHLKKYDPRNTELHTRS